MVRDKTEELLQGGTRREGGQSALSASSGVWARPRRLGSSSKDVKTQAT